jgi:tetratricopeptide (TPR) repeat protein
MRIPSVIAVVVAAAAALAVRDGPYEDCMALVARAPQQALAEAEAWARRGGGPAAEHCAAMALAAEGAWRRAAERLGDLAARAVSLPPEARAEMLEQAGAFWLQAGDAGLAQAAADQGLAIAREAPALLTLRAEAHAALGAWAAASADLDRALRAAPGDPTLLTLRAAARRNAGDAAGALSDARAAAAAAPGSAAALFERGAAEAALGETAAARRSWLDAVAAEPEAPAAAQARLSLQALDGS